MTQAQRKSAAVDLELLGGEAAQLFAQIGSGGATPSTPPMLRHDRADSVPALEHFLRGYLEGLLVPVEWPAICQAYGHASRQELRELIALGRGLASDPRLAPFAEASQRVGRIHLKRLRPLHDDRFVQRYLQAVEEGEAVAWHTLVYGVILSVYSLPLRQGLQKYAGQTLRGFATSAASRQALPEEGMRQMIDRLDEAVPGPLEKLLSLHGAPLLRPL